MLKIMFLTPSDLVEVLSEIVRRDDPECTCSRVGYSETLGTDVATLKKQDVFRDVPICDFLQKLNTYYGVKILSYDVYEIGDWGEGFAFILE